MNFTQIGLRSSQNSHMSAAEKRILENQFEIMWALNFLVRKVCPDLVGKAGEVDRVRDDLAGAAKETKALLEKE